MNYFFVVLSAAYILGIFFLADSSLVSQISVFNPRSLLHIPLYGILTILLVLAFQARPTNYSKLRYIFAALVAIAVASCDEFYQSFIPSREASATDIFLDVVGIFLAIILFHQVSPFFERGFSKRWNKVKIDRPS
ncbi:MAG: VanZ family protein [Pseudomonadota bacterium]